RRPATGHRARLFRRAEPDADRPAARRTARHREDAHETGNEQVEAGPAGPVGRGPLNPQEYENLAPLYALGALDGEDLVRFTEELKRSESLRALVLEYQEASTALPQALEPVAPSPGLKDRVLAAATGQKTARPAMLSRVFWSAAAAFLFVLLIGNLFREREYTNEAVVKPGPGAPAAAGKVLWVDRY